MVDLDLGDGLDGSIESQVLSLSLVLDDQGGLVADDTGLGLLDSCADQQILKWIGSVWTCADDDPGPPPPTVGTLDGRPRSPDGATIEDNVLYLQTADEANAGLVGTEAQAWSGLKTLVDGLAVDGSSTLGDASDDTLVLNGSSVSLPNGLIMSAAGGNGMSFAATATESSAFTFAADGITTGTGLSLSVDGLGAGAGVFVESSSGGLTGDLARFEATGAGAGVSGNVLKVGLLDAAATGTGLNLTSAGSGPVLRVNDDGTYFDPSPVVVASDGRVGIGTATPISPLQVFTTTIENGWSGRGSFGGGSNAVVLGQLNGGAAIGAHNAAHNQWATLLINPDPGASVGIGTANPDVSGIRLDVEGDVEIGQGTTGCLRDNDNTILTGTCSSDRSLKTNVSDAQNDYLNKVLGLELVHYNWRDEPAGQRQLGVIAQQVREVAPELVVSEPGQPLKVRFDALPFYLVGAIHQLRDEMEALASVRMSDLRSLSETGALTVNGSLTVRGDLSVERNVAVGPDAAGVVAVEPGSDRGVVTFKTARSHVPVVTATPMGPAPNFHVSEVTTTGFTIVLDRAASERLTFSWIAMGS